MKGDEQVLTRFLRIPLNGSEKIFDIFSKLPNAIRYEFANSSCVYVPGTRKDRVCLVAHADTVWDNSPGRQNLVFVDNLVTTKSNAFPSLNNYRTKGLGADDRAGIAMLWLLRNSGHSLLITDKEEQFLRGAIDISKNNDLIKEINSHSFLIELDKKGNKEFKTYDVTSPEFDKFIAEKTGFVKKPNTLYTDISVLCQDVCGVNFSVGYYNEHTRHEFLNLDHWQTTLDTMRNFLKEDMPRFTFSRKNRFANCFIHIEKDDLEY